MQKLTMNRWACLQRIYTGNISFIQQKWAAEAALFLCPNKTLFQSILHSEKCNDTVIITKISFYLQSVGLCTLFY